MKRRISRRMTPAFEGLEGRTVPSLYYVQLYGGVLTIAGNDYNDNARVSPSSAYPNWLLVEDFTNGNYWYFYRSSVGQINFIGNGGNDIFKNQTNVFGYSFGGYGNDWLEGGSNNDVIYGGPGNDVLYGWNGNDVLVGEDGNDWMYGGYGNDWLYGMNDYDTLYGGNGYDYLNGGFGYDWIYDFYTERFITKVDDPYSANYVQFY